MEALLDPPPPQCFHIEFTPTIRKNFPIRPALRLPISNSINLPEINTKRT